MIQGIFFGANMRKNPELFLKLILQKQNSNITKTINWYPAITKQTMKGVKQTWQNQN